MSEIEKKSVRSVAWALIGLVCLVTSSKLVAQNRPENLA